MSIYFQCVNNNLDISYNIKSCVAKKKQYKIKPQILLNIMKVQYYEIADWVEI